VTIITTVIVIRTTVYYCLRNNFICSCGRRG